MASFREIAANYAPHLQDVAGKSTMFEVRLLLCHAANISLEELLRSWHEQVPPSIELQIEKLIARRKLHEPISYITGIKEFYGLNMKVSPSVLIPRPETELLVDEAISLASSGDNILELGTGSGAIAVAIAKNIAQLQIIAADISHSALAQAKENISHYKLEGSIKLIQSDWFDNIKAKNKFDLIISNPPYIGVSEQDIMAKETLIFEPKKALFAANNGLKSYEEIISKAPKYLKKGGHILLEIGLRQGQEVLGLLSKNDFTETRIIKDLAGLDRAVRAKYQP